MPRLSSPLSLALACAAFAASQASPALAAVEVAVSKVELKSAPGNEAFCQGAKCWIAKGSTVRVMAHGVGIAQANSISDGTGVTSELTGAGSVGQKEVNIKVGEGAARGNSTITLKYKAGGNTITEWPFQIFVLNRGKVVGAQMPTLNDFFDTVEVEVSGQQLAFARVYPWGMGDFHNPAPTVTETANDNDTVKVRLTWPKKQSRRAVKFRLCDEALPSGELCMPVKYGQVDTVAKGPPAVSSITFSPQPAKVGEILNITFTLNQPARPGGETVWWQLADAANFDSVGGSCPFSKAGGKNQVAVPANSATMTCQVKVTHASGVSAMTQWLKSWVVNHNNNDAPYYFEQALKIKSL
jgi:hypothetical protein